MTTIGIIGAGHIGSQVARAAADAGYDVVISNSRGPDTLADLVKELGPKVRAATAAEAAEAGDFAVVTVPFKAYRDVPVAALAGKVVVDTNNYYWERDGRYPELDNGSTSVSELLQQHLPTSKVVKGFNHIQSPDITTDGTPAGTEDRRALALAGDDVDAKAVLAALYEQFGFEPVDAGGLAEGWRFDRDQPAYVARQNAEEMRANLGRAVRPDSTP